MTQLGPMEAYVKARKVLVHGKFRRHIAVSSSFLSNEVPVGQRLSSNLLYFGLPKTAAQGVSLVYILIDQGIKVHRSKDV